jgi:GNAT superfamily N-acetyltransferase
MDASNWYERKQFWNQECCRRLTAERVVEPLSTEDVETKAWNLYELASLVEGHLHEQLDVARLSNASNASDTERLAWEQRVTYDGGPLRNPHDNYCRPFWLLAGDGRRIGTLAIATMIYGFDLISVSSLYVDPAARGCGIARRALEAVFRAAVASGAGGFRLDASWTWQPSVRFYARIGMWVWMWKHDLVFTWQKHLPPYRVEIGDSEARFFIEQDGQWRVMVTARNLGDRLGWEPAGLEGQPIDQPIEVSRCIPGTFALHLALAGWPLIRSAETWENRYHWSDAGEPEGLAYKIEIFEAVDRKRGFEVRTPRIPWIQYRELDEI